MPGVEARLDPDAVTRVEISSKDNPHAFLKISLKGQHEPTVLEFASRKEAIDFYEAIWQQRQSREEQIVEVGEFG